MAHIPVLTKEVLEYLNPKENENFVDCTVGQAGHAKLILEKTGPLGKVLGIDADPEQIENCKELLKDFKDRLILANDSYANLPEILKKENFGKIDGILLDLGVSSWQLEESKKGFSFLKDEPLDMRMSSTGITAAEILNSWDEHAIELILRGFGEEKSSRKIAREIVERRKIKPFATTFDLVKVVGKRRGKIHPATKTFQALRIAVNEELTSLEIGLEKGFLALGPNGRLVVISFHSLEDRIVKNFFRNKIKEKVARQITTKPIIPSAEEVKKNSRSRSAKLRVIEKI